MSATFYEYSAMCYGAYRAMTEDQRQELLNWELENLDGSTIGTIDWPGWIAILGPPPKMPIPISKPKKKMVPRKIRSQIFERDRYRCAQCGTWKNLTIDHIIPEAKGGTNEFSNLQTLCQRCNSSKGVKYE